MESGFHDLRVTLVNSLIYQTFSGSQYVPLVKFGFETQRYGTNLNSWLNSGILRKKRFIKKYRTKQISPRQNSPFGIYLVRW